MATYLVTGGAGFIGSHLCDALCHAGHQVVVLDDLSNGSLSNLAAEVEFVEGNILDAGLVDQLIQRVDGCFHLAAIPSIEESSKRWAQTHAVNLTGTVNVLNSARANQPRRVVPVVFASSSAVYGNLGKKPVTESAKMQPIAAYGVDKYAAELYAAVAGFQYQVPTACLRLFNVYGPRQNPSSPYAGVIALFAKALHDKQPVTIYGDGQQSRDYIYVKDVVEFFVRAMACANTKSLVLNVCTGRSTTLLELFDSLCQVTHQSVPIHYADAKSTDIVYSCGDPSLAQQILGYTAQYSLAEVGSDL